MSTLDDLLDFYIKEAWTKDEEDGTLHPSDMLIADKGRRAYEFKHPTEGKPLVTEDVRKAAYIVALAEIADAMRDLARCINMPHSEHRVLTIGLCIQNLQNAEFAIRKVTRT
jgi:hypothetical protein